MLFSQENSLSSEKSMHHLYSSVKVLPRGIRYHEREAPDKLLIVITLSVLRFHLTSYPSRHVSTQIGVPPLHFPGERLPGQFPGLGGVSLGQGILNHLDTA